MGYDPDKYVQVTAYLERGWKPRMQQVRTADRRYSMSRIIEEALAAYLPVLERSYGLKSPKPKAVKESLS